ncbi:hypothetical protein CC86DRAFT_409750 [Ophiobolus disseminans]|uniref:2EXR domain-containing protein n=1 Tax=Ophiobolus disseminans TaxID=1469910 RepID=A0A6A6ZQU1_9PLEO|nr:hypothetical protein CC86DRAFT_409750 [Ophiobolus disseminans]
MRKFVRRTTHTVVALRQKSPGSSDQSPGRRSTSRSSLLGKLRPSSTDGVSCKDPENLTHQQPDYAASELHPNTDSDSERESTYDRKRMHEQLKSLEEERRTKKKTHIGSRNIQQQTQQLIRNRGRWLFSADRLSVYELDDVEQQTQKMLVQMQRALKEECPGEYLYLCLMKIPQELRDMIWNSHFAPLPNIIVVRPKMMNRRGLMQSDVSHILPALCYVNHQFFEECIPVFLPFTSIEPELVDFPNSCVGFQRKQLSARSHIWSSKIMQRGPLRQT